MGFTPSIKSLVSPRHKLRSPRRKSKLAQSSDSPRLVRTPAIETTEASRTHVDVDVSRKSVSVVDASGDTQDQSLNANEPFGSSLTTKMSPSSASLSSYADVLVRDDEGIFELTLTSSPVGSSTTLSSYDELTATSLIDDDTVTGRLARQLAQMPSHSIAVNYPPLRAGDEDNESTSSTHGGSMEFRDVLSVPPTPEDSIAHTSAALEHSGGNDSAHVLGTSPLYVGKPVISTETQLLLHSTAASKSLSSKSDNDDDDDDDEKQVEKVDGKKSKGLERQRSFTSHISHAATIRPSSPSISLRGAINSRDGSGYILFFSKKILVLLNIFYFNKQ